MTLRSIIECFIYTLVIILSLVALWLVASVPANFLNTRVIYQGF